MQLLNYVMYFNTLISNHFHSLESFFIFVCQTTWVGWNVRQWASGVNVHNENSNRYARFNVPQLKEFLAFSVRDISIKYIICIKDFDAQTITSLKLNLFSSFIYCCQHHERKTICLDIFLLSDRQWGTEHQYLLGRFLGVSILQFLIIYRIYDHDISTLSQ